MDVDDVHRILAVPEDHFVGQFDGEACFRGDDRNTSRMVGEDCVIQLDFVGSDDDGQRHEPGRSEVMMGCEIGTEDDE